MKQIENNVLFIWLTALSSPASPSLYSLTPSLCLSFTLCCWAGEEGATYFQCCVYKHRPTNFAWYAFNYFLAHLITTCWNVQLGSGGLHTGVTNQKVGRHLSWQENWELKTTNLNEEVSVWTVVICSSFNLCFVCQATLASYLFKYVRHSRIQCSVCFTEQITSFWSLLTCYIFPTSLL